MVPITWTSACLIDDGRVRVQAGARARYQVRRPRPTGGAAHVASTRRRLDRRLHRPAHFQPIIR
jgi:hypothetical protein